jgi:hypothetical protein
MSKTDGHYHAPERSLRAALQTVLDVPRWQGKVHAALGGMLALAVCALWAAVRLPQLVRDQPVGPGQRPGDPQGTGAAGEQGSGGRV